MSAIGQPNLRRLAGSWDGTLRKLESCFVKEGFKLAAKTGYSRTVSNIQGKGIPNDGSSYRKNARSFTFSAVPIPSAVLLTLAHVDCSE